MWVQLTSIQYVADHGVQKTCYPGDWVDVGKQQALLWVSQGSATLPDQGKYSRLVVGAGAGVLVVSQGDRDQVRAAAEEMLSPYPNLAINVSPAPALPFEQTAIWDLSVRLRPELIPIGLALLDKWQAAAPIFDYSRLASHEGDVADRQKTAAVLPDLRVPLYETGLMFVRRDADTERLFEKWAKEREDGGDARHAFLRALYTTPLLFLALPITWTGKQVKA